MFVIIHYWTLSLQILSPSIIIKKNVFSQTTPNKGLTLSLYIRIDQNQQKEPQKTLYKSSILVISTQMRKMLFIDDAAVFTHTQAWLYKLCHIYFSLI